MDFSHYPWMAPSSLINNCSTPAGVCVCVRACACVRAHARMCVCVCMCVHAYHIVPSKHQSLCKHPPPFLWFDQCTFKSLIHVSKHPPPILGPRMTRAHRHFLGTILCIYKCGCMGGHVSVNRFMLGAWYRYTHFKVKAELLSNSSASCVMPGAAPI